MSKLYKDACEVIGELIQALAILGGAIIVLVFSFAWLAVLVAIPFVILAKLLA